MGTLLTVSIRILEVIFMLGILGSAVVLILTLIEDAKSLLPGKKESSGQGLSRSRRVPSHLHTSDPIA